MAPGLLCEDSAARQRRRNPNSAKPTENAERTPAKNFSGPNSSTLRSPPTPPAGTNDSGIYKTILNAAHEVQLKLHCAVSSRTSSQQTPRSWHQSLTRITAIEHKMSTLFSLSEERVAEMVQQQTAAATAAASTNGLKELEDKIKAQQLALSKLQETVRPITPPRQANGRPYTPRQTTASDVLAVGGWARGTHHETIAQQTADVIKRCSAEVHACIEKTRVPYIHGSDFC
eukprot:2007477-Amphidinium_carterae.1